MIALTLRLYNGRGMDACGCAKSISTHNRIAIGNGPITGVAHRFAPFDQAGSDRYQSRPLI